MGKIIYINSPKYGIKEVLVDDNDYENLIRFKWFVQKHGDGFYASATINRKLIKMHRYLLGIHKSKTPIVDHKDRNKLNNKRDNLRICTPQQNGANRRVMPNGTSKYLGVCFIRRDKKWQASIKVNGKTINLGLVKEEIVAAKLYNNAAIIYHGEFANLNVID